MPTEVVPQSVVGDSPPTEGYFQAYPTDPTDGIAEIIRYFDGTGDYRNLVAGVYDEIGFVLNMFIGVPNTEMDPIIMGAALADLQKAVITNPEKLSALPDWAKPLLSAAVHALYTWLLSRKNPAPG